MVEPKEKDFITVVCNTPKQAADDLVAFIVDGERRETISTEPLEQFMARGRVEDCDCQLIECVCTQARQHQEDCKYRVALSCAVPIECDHGYDVCPQCDPCTCEKKGSG